MTPDCGPARVIAVDLGGTWLRAATFDEKGGIVRRAAVATERSRGPLGIVDQIDSLVRQVGGSHYEAPSKRKVVVIGVPGTVNPATGVVLVAANLPGWHDVPLKQMLETKTGYECLVEHDANLAALAEYRRWTVRAVAHFAYVTVSTGIGAGLVFDGHLYRGGTGSAGEFGHMVAVMDGPLCRCGNQGCLDAVASGSAIARMAGADSAEDVARAAAAGDEPSRLVLAVAARHLGIALGGLINLLNLDAVALGGGVFGAGDMYWDSVMAAVAEASFVSTRQHCRFTRAQLGGDQGLVGAFELAHHCLASSQDVAP